MSPDRRERSQMCPWALWDVQRVIGTHIWSHYMFLKHFLKIEFFNQKWVFWLERSGQPLKNTIFTGLFEGKSPGQFDVSGAATIRVLTTLWTSQSARGHIWDLPRRSWDIWWKKVFWRFFNFFALILAYFWLESGIQLRVKNSKTLFFSKWSLISKIRHGYGLRLYLNLLRRLWRPRKRQIGPDFFLQTGPWK